MERKKRFVIGNNPILLGLCDGIANYVDVNVWVIRLLVLVTGYLITGSVVLSFLLYVAVVFFIPQQKAKYKADNDHQNKE